MAYLTLVRHGKSLWNQKNKFTGWIDIELSEKGKEEAKKVGLALTKKDIPVDVAFSSALKRAIHTSEIILKTMDLPIKFKKVWQLNERHYGSLQGKNKSYIRRKYGKEQFQKWRRSFDIAPPPLEEKQILSPPSLYKGLKTIPKTESLKDTFNRVVPFFDSQIRPLLRKDISVLITAHGNSIRALMKSLEYTSDSIIHTVEVRTGKPIVYSFTPNLLISSKEWL